MKFIIRQRKSAKEGYYYSLELKFKHIHTNKEAAINFSAYTLGHYVSVESAKADLKTKLINLHTYEEIKILEMEK